MPQLQHRIGIVIANFLVLAACHSSDRGPTGRGGASSTGTAAGPGTGAGGGVPDVPRTDITSAVLANKDIVLAYDAVIDLPPGTTTYTGVISGKGTLRLTPAGGVNDPSTWVITKTNTFSLPDDQQVEVVTKTTYPGAGYDLSVAGVNPPVLLIDAGVTFQIGTNTAADQNPNIVATSDSKNPASVVNGEINLDNIRDDGAIALESAQSILLGRVTGSGLISQPQGVWGGVEMSKPGTFAGVFSIMTGANAGSNHVASGLSGTTGVVNQGSWLVWSPPASVVQVSSTIYEATFGSDINFHSIGNSTIVMKGVYSHTDNSTAGAPNLVNPTLSRPELNLCASVRYKVGPNGHDASYRGINIEAGAGTVQWGDGTNNVFFLPSAPSPAEVNPTLGVKNAYINLRGSTLAFDYNGPVTLNVGITGGGGGPHKDGTPGTGNVTIMPTPGNDVTFAQPQDYNGTTTIGAGAILRLGAGQSVPLNYATINGDGTVTQTLIGTYTGDSSLLTVESARGNAGDKIVNDGKIIVQNTTTSITLSHISGSGSVVQAGPAPVTVLANTYRGGTFITGGTLIAGDADALGDGDVENDAELAGGDAVGVIRVRGNYVQGDRGVLTLNIDTSGEPSTVRIDGQMVLGGVLDVHVGAAPKIGDRYAVVRAEGGLIGRFGTVVAHGVPDELALVASYDATTCYLTVARKHRPPRRTRLVAASRLDSFGWAAAPSPQKN